MAVELGVDIIRNVASGDTLPLVIKPSNIESSSIDHLKNWISDNQTCINEYLLEYGKVVKCKGQHVHVLYRCYSI